jgi:DNA-binding Xre family transcriptional regulator
MINWTLRDAVGKRGWTAYKLAQKTGLPIPTAYKLMAEDYEPTRLDVATLDKICTALNVQPGSFLKWERDK